MKQLLFGTLITLGILGWNDTETVQPPARAWVATSPVQCLGNDWERDWLDSHDGNYSAYPEDPDSRNKIIVDYYELQEVEVFQVIREPWDDGVCLACSCPALTDPAG